MGIRLAVLDDNPHVAWEGRTHPVDATFHRFLAALLDAPGGPVSELIHVVPVRPARSRPATDPVDPRIRTVATAPFSGIGDYLRRWPVVVARNARPVRRAIRHADLLLLRLPASNAPLAAAIAVIERRPRFGYVAGSARDVAAARSWQGPMRWAAVAVGAAYDAVSNRAGGRDATIRVGEHLLDDGIVTSLVEAHEIRRDAAGRRHDGGDGDDGLRLAWAGRLVSGKGVETLIDALAALGAARDGTAGSPVSVRVLGDGPHRASLVARAAAAGVGDRVTWLGHVSDRGAYLEALATSDLFVFPSPAEGFPKVILDAAAVGLPILASPVGAIRELAEAGLVVPVEPGDPVALASAIRDLVGDTARADRLRADGLRFAADHTRPAEAARFIRRLQAHYPLLPWS
jgi:glycosyltransferase involved in cell wall biosynthesis